MKPQIIHVSDWCAVFFFEGNIPSKKNGRIFIPTKRGKVKQLDSKQIRKYKKEVELQFGNEFAKFVWKKFIRKGSPAYVTMKFLKVTSKFDYINPAQTIQDSLVDFDWIDDDNTENLFPVFSHAEKVKRVNTGIYISIGIDDARGVVSEIMMEEHFNTGKTGHEEELEKRLKELQKEFLEGKNEKAKRDI